MASLPLIVALLFATGLCCVKSATVIVDPFTFPFSCPGHESGKLVRNLGKDGHQQVAAYEHGEWKPVGRYRDWIRGNSSVIVFTRTFYPGSKVIYEVSCRNESEKLIQLDLVVAHHVSVRPGEAALLPCFSDPKENPGSSVHWEKNGAVLCELTQNSTSAGCNKSADERFYVSQNWSSTGDMSLTLEHVQPEDQGDYFCSGSKNPVRLKVTETDTQTRTSPSPDPPKEKPLETWIIIIITVFVTLLVSAPCSILIGWFLHSHRTKISCLKNFPQCNSFFSASYSQANGGQNGQDVGL